MHQRKEIRAQIVAALRGETAAGDRVFDLRHDDLAERELPAITVMGGPEQVEALCPTPRVESRTFEVSVKAYVDSIESSEACEAALDAITSEIEGILVGELLGGLLEDLTLTGSTPERSGSGKFFAAMILTFEAKYLLEEA